MVEMRIILDTFILLMRRVNLLWGLKQDQRRSSLALKLTKVSEVFNCKHGVDRTAGEKGKRKDAEQILKGRKKRWKTASKNVAKALEEGITKYKRRIYLSLQTISITLLAR